MQDGNNVLDRITQTWVRMTGRKVLFADYPWLLGPTCNPHQIDDSWLDEETERVGGDHLEGGGLLDQIGDLTSDDFDPTCLANPIVEFYEHTSDWRMEVWSQWGAVAWPFGWLISSVFSRRLGQLNLPLRPVDTAQGMDSRVVRVLDKDGSRVGAAWLRTLRTTGRITYSGWYGTAALPEAHYRSLRVVFPLPNGSVTVFLRAQNRPDGALMLVSGIGPFGSEGAYLLVAQPDRKSGWVRRVPLVEEFVITADGESALRTDHTLKLWRIPVFQLHYRMTKVQHP
jgi:hypothetical protein